MAETSKIEWTDATWNCWYGCRPVSIGCDHCYMFRDMARYGRDPHVITRSKTTFKDPLKWARNNKLKPGSRIFVCSWSDFFIPNADKWRGEAWDIIRETPEYNFLILTKRIKNVADRLPSDWGNGYKNVWLGVTAENQEQADKRIPILLQIPAEKRFVSIEPMLGAVDISEYLSDDDYQPPRFLDEEETYSRQPKELIDWVILGAESGPKRRHIDYMKMVSVVQQCNDAGIPAFVKQIHNPFDGSLIKDFGLFPPELQIRQYPEVT